jgi:hypothetical protein
LNSRGFFAVRNVVGEEHNEIWEMQGGTVGKAYGIASPQEGMAFIQKNVKVER